MEQGKCNGRCESCNVNQRTYCASQMAYFAQQDIAEIKAVLNELVKNDITILNSEPNVSGAEIIN